jgi:ketosteroid isomerase-like protein
VDEFNRRFVESCRNMDNALAIALWSEDGVDLLPGMEPMVGKAAISKWLTDLTEQTKGAKMLQCDVDWQKIQISGDVAYEWGINTQTVSVPNQADPFKNKGKITLILRKQSDGSWKLVLESWNSSPRS